MKGISTKDKKKHNKTKASGKPNGNVRRAVLRAGNRAYNLARRAKTKLRRMAAGVPGSYQGRHIKNAECHCGGCNSGYVRP